ncbi:MAG: pyridoxamine 5'-phosphate oxidase family protein [Nitriliruptorales bacterium]|nr:pyridoxamine 5'-phosphate oxidase family protein [Nitriliruptorales bacterium]
MERTTERPTDHSGLEILDVDECLERLASQPVGRIAYIDAGAPIVLPVNHRVEGRQIVFRTTHGSKLAAALMERPVAFEVDSYSEDERTGWSVLVRGRAEVLFDPAESSQVTGPRPQPWADQVQRGWWVRIHPEEISGRRLPDRPVEELRG